MKHFKRYSPLIIIIFVISAVLSCTKEAPTVNLEDYFEDPVIGVNPGYFYPFVSAVYPADETNDVAVNSDYVIVFNMPVDGEDLDENIRIFSTNEGGYLVNGTDYEIYDINDNNPPSDPTTIARISFSYGGVNPLSANDSLQISVLGGIHEAVSGTDVAINLDDSVGINASSPWSFTTGTEPDVTAPTVTITGLNPTPTNGATGVSLTAPNITIIIGSNDDLDITSINSNTLYLEDYLDKVAATYSYNSSTNTITLIPSVTLTPYDSNPAPPDIGEYTVTLFSDGVSTGIKDLSGNYLAATSYSWSFTTTTLPYDPNGDDTPTIDAGPNVFDLTLTSAYVNWTTSEATDYLINWGRGDDFPETPIDGSGDFSSFQSDEFTGLTQGVRYWMNVVASDNQNNSVTSSTVQFNTLTPHTGATIDTSTGNQYTVKTISWNPLDGSNDGIFMFWTSNTGNSHIYGQRFDNALNKDWGALPNAIFTEVGQNKTHMCSVEDNVDGAIVLASRTAGGIYAKRINSSGTIMDWNTVGDDGTDSGLLIDASGTNASTVPVYTNFIDAAATVSGQVDRNSLTLPNYFYEDDFDIWALTADGDIIYSTDDGNGTTIDRNPVGTDFQRYILGQDTFYAVSNAGHAVENYIVGESANTDSFTAVNHGMFDTTPYTNDATHKYTPHGYNLVKAGWTVNVGDIITDGTNYAQITAITAISVAADLEDSGTPNRTLSLVDAGTDFSATGLNIQTTDRVRNETTSSALTAITNVSEKVLTLSVDRFTNTTDFYEIFDFTTPLVNGASESGTVTWGDIDTLEDDTFDFSSVADTTDIVRNSTLQYADITGLSGAGPYYCDVSNTIFTAGADQYWIYDRIAYDNPDYTNLLVDRTASWMTAPHVLNGWLVLKTNAPTNFTTVNGDAAYNNYIELNAHIFPTQAAPEAYEIYSNYCVTHTGTVTTFYLIETDRNLAGNNLIIYNRDAVIGAQATDTPPANPLYDSDANFLGLASGVNGDILFNYTTGDRAYIDTTTTPYPIHTYAIDLSANIFPTDNQQYRILSYDANLTNNVNYNSIIDSGIADSDTLSHLTDAGHFGTVSTGDVAFNVSTQQYAMVTNVAAGNLTLSWDAFPAGNEPYLIFNCRGVLYVWQEAGPVIRGKILSIAAGVAPVELVSEATIGNIANGQNPKAISDGLGNALVVYEDTAGEIQVEKIDATGTTLWTTEIDTQTANAETVIDVQSDNNAGVVILYKYNNNLHAQRLNSAGTRQWGNNGLSMDNVVATSQENMAYDSNSDDVFVVYNDSDEIMAVRRDFATTDNWGPVNITSLPLSIQQNPNIFLDGADALIVWDDERFQRYMGYGVFGVKINAADGSKNAAWNANTTGTADTNGVAIILSNFNEVWPNVHLAPYNVGGASREVILIWEDYQSNQSDLLFIDPNVTGAPYFPAGINLPY